jgi:hypothetical protein
MMMSLESPVHARGGETYTVEVPILLPMPRAAADFEIDLFDPQMARGQTKISAGGGGVKHDTEKSLATPLAR